MTTKKQSITTTLAEYKLREHWIKWFNGAGGKQLAYMSGEQYFQMLNEDIGYDAYNWTLSKPEYIRNHEERIICISIKGTLEVHPLNIIREGHGTHQVNDDSAIADGVKTAETDALKRACRTLNLGLQLYFMKPKPIESEDVKRQYAGVKPPTDKQATDFCVKLGEVIALLQLDRSDVDNYFGVAKAQKPEIVEWMTKHRGQSPQDLAFAVSYWKNGLTRA